MTDDFLQFSAEIDPGSIVSGAPTRAAIVRIRDVIVCAVDNNDNVEVEEYRLHPPVGEERIADDDIYVESVTIGEGAFLRQLADDEAELIANACTQRGHYFHPIRQFGQRYSFERERPLSDAEDHRFGWDPDHVLGDALMLSRLVRDNGFSMQWAARIIEYEDGQKSVIYTPGHEGKGTYRLRRDREWLDGPEAEELARLFAAFRGAELPDRVGRAMWRCEYATWQRYTDVALPMMVGGLEALLGLGRTDTSRRFKDRLAAMAGELGIDGVDGDLLDRMYEGRSAWVHGAPVRLFDPAADPEREPDAQPDAAMEAVLTEIVTLQDTLRAALRMAIEAPEFRAVFESEASIAEQWSG